MSWRAPTCRPATPCRKTLRRRGCRRGLRGIAEVACRDVFAGEYTSGEVTYAADYLSSFSNHGSASLRWDGRPGGTAVALIDGVLVFATLQRDQSLHRLAEGTTMYFVTQDPKRVNFSGLIPPGQYSALTFVSSATIAVVVKPEALLDVVGRDDEVISVQLQRL